MSHATRPFLKSTIATLCVVLSLVFAGASATELVNRVQHDVQLEHAHNHHGGGDEPAFGLDVQDSGTEKGDSPDGHHHSDAPAGLLAADLVSSTELPDSNLRLTAAAAEMLRGSPPHGPERPPKPFATRA